jgi:hypothetical protein
LFCSIVGGYFLEQMIIAFLMIGAISITTQSNLVDIIFNFGAILIIADLDSILMKTFPI